MRDDNAVNRSGGGNRYIIDDSINWVAQKFETGNKGNVEAAARKSFAEHRWMIEVDGAGPSSNQWTSIEVFDATDAERFQSRLICRAFL